MVRAVRKTRMKRVALSEVEGDLSKYLKLAEVDEVVITRDSKPAGVLIGFRSEDGWLDYRFETDPRIPSRIEAARRDLREGQGIKVEDLPD